jgi:uncharacterized protein (TIGR01777 family)
VQTTGPFALWEHTHTITPDGADRCVLEDRIEYVPPGGSAGQLIAGSHLRDMLQRVFAYRHRVTADDMSRHQAYKERSSMKVLVSGASGLIGSQLIPLLTTGGHEVHRLVRTAKREPRTIQWDPQLGNIDRERLSGFDAVIHLSGENIAKRWTRKQMVRIRESRIDSTHMLCDALARTAAPPKTFLCASAVGFYGNRGNEVLDESSPPGKGFLPDVCVDWEQAAEPVRSRGIRTAHLRFGIVLSPAGGALGKMLLPFKLGLGGPIGDGKQYWSWIGIDDAIGAIHHVLMNESVSGPVNMVAPQQTTNREFTETLGRVLRRPTVLPMPAIAARIVFGKMANGLFLASTRVAPKRLEESGYEFKYPMLEAALRHLLGK